MHRPTWAFRVGLLGLVVAVALALAGCGQIQTPQTQPPTALQTQSISWSTATVAEGYDYDTSIALDGDGVPHIAYVDASEYPPEIWYASYDPDTGEWSSQLVTDLYRLEPISLAFDKTTDEPHIAFLDNGELRYASPASGSDTDWMVEAVDPGAHVGNVSLAFDLDGFAHLSYARYVEGTFTYDLYYASRDSDGWSKQLVYSMGADGVVGYGASLAFDSAGAPHISFRYATATWGVCGLLYTSYVTDAGSPGWADPETVDACNSDAYSFGSSASESSLALDQDDNPHISYTVQAIGRPGVLRYAYRDSDGWHTADVDESESDTLLADFPSLALDQGGNPHISYAGAHPDPDTTHPALTHAWLENGTWQHEVVDASADGSGWYTSLAIDRSTNKAYISYDLFGDTQDLRIAVGTIAASVAPEEAIANLETAVESLGYLKTGQVTGLTKPLDNALRSLDKDKIADACNQLADFVGEVEAKTPTPIGGEDATALISAADAIRDDLGCVY